MMDRLIWVSKYTINMLKVPKSFLKKIILNMMNIVMELPSDNYEA